jgi:hypothetical protein
MNSASLEVIGKLCEYGGKDLVMATNDFGQTALHMLCKLYGLSVMKCIKALCLYKLKGMKKNIYISR